MNSRNTCSIVKSTHFLVSPTMNEIYMMWNPPQNQNIKIRGYIISWGKGVPDVSTTEVDERTRTYVIKNLGKDGLNICRGRKFFAL